MKTVAKILLLAAVVALFAFIGITYGVPVEKNDSIVYFGTNIYLLDNTNTPLHVRMQGFAAQDYWTNGIAVSATNTAEEIVELFVQREGWQGKIGLYDPTNGIYRLYPHDGIVNGSYTTNPPLSLWDGETGTWLGSVSNSVELSNTSTNGGWSFDRVMGCSYLRYGQVGSGRGVLIEDGVFEGDSWSFEGDVNSDSITIGSGPKISNICSFVSAPPTSTNAGTPGMMAWTNGEFYLCVSNATWRRVGMTNW